LVDTGFTILRPDARAYPMIGVPSFAASRAIGLPTYDYLVSVTTPEYLTVANGGALVDKRASNGQVTYTYRNLKPAWRMDIAIARYLTLESGGNRVFCFTGDSAGGVRVLKQLKRTLDLYTDWFGPLRGADAFTVIEIPDGHGSQADVTSIIQTAATFKNPERSVELYHEISHLWNVVPTEAHPPRWNEGLAMFLQSYTADVFDGTNQLAEVAKRRWKSLGEMISENPERRNIAMIDYGKENVTGMSYSVGMIMFYLLNDLAGEEMFMHIIGEYYRRYHDTGAGTEELVSLVRELAGDSVAAFLREWFYTTKPARYAVSRISLDELLERYRE
ncbi:MAG: M1 family aminopeptidase, partial [Candidatus Zixiibacteriota bacterium]